MKRNPTLIRLLPVVAGGTMTLSAFAGSFTNSPGDLFLAFRESGEPDLVVDIGQASIYDAVAPGATIQVTNLPVGLPNLLNNTYPSLDGLSWTVTGAFRAVGAYPLETIWASSPRSVVTVPTAPWNTQDQYAQGGPASQIAAIGANAATYSSANPVNSSNNTATAVVIPNSSPDAFTKLIESPLNNSYGNLGGAFQGNVENTTPFDFDSGEPLSVSDLYQLEPVALHTTGTGTWVGYFSFTPDGNFTFTAGTVAPPAPTITSVVRNGNITKVSFTTSAGHTYGLSATNLTGLRAPRSSWPAVGGTITGTGSVLSLQDTNSSSTTFYTVTAH
jgi:hypothetical protein